MSATGDLVRFLTTADNWWGGRGIVHRTWEHVRISAFATGVAVLAAVPLAAVLGHIRRGGVVAVGIVNIGRAVPSFAILALALPLSLEWGFGLGFWPTAVALVLLAVPPVFTNAYTGVVSVDPATVEAARSMGMRGRQVLWRVELPVALPLLLTGVRIAAVQVVATATLGALVGFGCLGSFIIEGQAQFDDGRLLGGAVLVAALAVLTEVTLGATERALTPWAGRGLPAPADDPHTRGETP